MRQYANRSLRPVEAMLLDTHRTDLAGTVLELGCGAGRITGYLIERAQHAIGLDLSPRMVRECRRRYPGGEFVAGDMRDLSRFRSSSIDAVIAGNNVIDVFSDADRRAALEEIRRVLTPGGLLVFSSHNRAYLPRVKGPTAVRRSDPARLVYDALNVPLRLVRHRRLRGLERDVSDYAIVSDGSHGFSLVHYYTTPSAQAQQLAQTGFALLACVALDGHALAADETAADCSELHYFARPATAPPPR